MNAFSIIETQSYNMISDFYDDLCFFFIIILDLESIQCHKANVIIWLLVGEMQETKFLKIIKKEFKIIETAIP